MSLHTPLPTQGSSTSTTVSTSATSISEPIQVLHLRGDPIIERRIQWDSDVIDNEGMGKKKSKICCIYHKPREFDESSSSSDDDTDSDASDKEEKTAAKKKRKEMKHRHCEHSHPRAEGHNSGDDSDEGDSDNAYEKQPGPRSKGASGPVNKPANRENP